MVMDTGRDSTGQDSGGRDSTNRNGSAHQSATGDLPDPLKLAQDWIVLWQSELSAMAADPELRESWQALIALWAGGMTSVLRSTPWTARPQPDDQSTRPARPADAPRPPPTAAAPDARDVEIERLARHVATLERRLAELERGSDPPVHPKRHPGRKPRS